MIRSRTSPLGWFRDVSGAGLKTGGMPGPLGTGPRLVRLGWVLQPKDPQAVIDVAWDHGVDAPADRRSDQREAVLRAISRSWKPSRRWKRQRCDAAWT